MLLRNLLELVALGYRNLQQPLAGHFDLQARNELHWEKLGAQLRPAPDADGGRYIVPPV